jgi:CheY-like chemotaxis protein
LAAGCQAVLPRPVRLAQVERALSHLLDPIPEPPDGVPAPLAALAAASSAGRLRRVLLAEDHRVNQKVAIHILKRLGAEIVVAADGAEAVAAAAAQPFDLILMDCQMPVLDGFQATAAIRAAEGPHRRTPIVALTANAMQGDRDRCLEAGMDDYLAKPVQREELAFLLEKWTAQPVPS